MSYLGKNRRNPYAVRPPVSEYDENGKPIKPKPICYASTWYAGFAALTAWKAGTYTPGMETEFDTSSVDSSNLAERIIADYLRVSKRVEGLSFSEVYKSAHEWKFSHQKLSKSAEKHYKKGYSRCKQLYNLPLVAIKQQDLQDVIDSCELSTSTLEEIQSVFRLVYKYAIANDIVNTDYSKGVILRKTEVNHGKAFSPDELKYIMDNLDDDNMKRVLIMCLSGFRISSYRSMEINLEKGYFYGGVKNEYSRDRIVPIHSAITPIVKDLTDRDGSLKIYPNTAKMSNAFRRINPEATPHWSRHTFSALCERFKVWENDRKRMLGHRVGDITNDVYGHRTLEDLRAEIEKIDVQEMVQQPEIQKV